MKKKLIALLLSASLLTTAMAWPASAANADQFTDVDKNDWFYPHVEYAVTTGLFSGTSETTFGPEEPMSRGMFVTVLGNKTGIDITQYPGTRFEDVDASMYYSTRINWATENGIVSGTGTGKFSPEASVTREQVATILYNYAKRTGNDTSFQGDAYYSFADTNRVSSYAVDAMKWATHHQILSGSDGKLDPQGTATRAQVAAIFRNAEKILIKTEILPTEKPSPTATPTATPAPTATPKPTPAPTVRPTPTPTPSTPVVNTVYWTPNGKSYHSTRNCTALKRSTTILSGTLDEAIRTGHSDPCNLCAR